MERNDLNVAYIVADVGQKMPENTIDTLQAGDKITHMRDIVNHKKENEKFDKNFNKGVGFVKIYDDMIDALADKLTLAEFRFAIRLTHHMSYDDGILRTKGHKQGKVLTIKDMSELLNINYANCCKLINALIDKGVIGKHITGNIDNPGTELPCFTCNPYIFMRGKKMDRSIISLFAKSGWDTLKVED